MELYNIELKYIHSGPYAEAAGSILYLCCNDVQLWGGERYTYVENVYNFRQKQKLQINT